MDEREKKLLDARKTLVQIEMILRNLDTDVAAAQQKHRDAKVAYEAALKEYDTTITLKGKY